METIRELKLVNYYAFEQFTSTFGPSAFMMGPNSAGKSTIIGAIRAIASMSSHARNRVPDRSVHDGLNSYLAFGLDGQSHGISEQHLRHEFRDLETRIQLSFSNGASVVAVWPPAEDPLIDDEPYYYLKVEGQPQPRRPKDVRSHFPTIGQVPILSPIERSETLIDTGRVRRNVDSRLAVRHFRNQLHLLSEQGLWHNQEPRWEDFLIFVEEWAPEIRLQELKKTAVPGEGYSLELFITEPETGSRSWKEIAWAGDGIQTWLMILLHLFRLRGSGIIILDEPDIYLHPDLQRRLVQLLESFESQTIVASHSSEMIGEANSEALIWVDKAQRRAMRNPTGSTIFDLSTALGSQFNLRFAKALRSKVVLFLEGNDMKILALLAKTNGSAKLATERGLAVIPIGGYSNWSHLEAFQWLTKGLLKDSIETFVVLDRDYRTDEIVADALRKLEASGIRPHVWLKKELESYLLVPEAIARASGAPLGWVRDVLAEIVDGFESDIRSNLQAEALQSAPKRIAPNTTLKAADDRFSRNWSVVAGRVNVVPPKEVIRKLNVKMQENGYETVSARKLANRLRADEIDGELKSILDSIELVL